MIYNKIPLRFDLTTSPVMKEGPKNTPNTKWLRLFSHLKKLSLGYFLLNLLSKITRLRDIITKFLKVVQNGYIIKFCEETISSTTCSGYRIKPDCTK